MMDCEDINPLLSHYLDGVVTGEEMRSISNHLDNCNECRHTCETIENVRQRVETIRPVKPPAGLALKIRLAIERSRQEQKDILFRLAAESLQAELRVEIAGVNEELMKHLARHPELLHGLNPRQFEEVVAEIFRDFGYDVIVTPRTRDGGVDIKAVKKETVGTLLYLIECKKYAEERPVGVDIVRGLYGVAMAERASYGVVATTSYFTRDAKEFASQLKYQMSLRDYKDLAKWLQQYKKRPNP